MNTIFISAGHGGGDPGAVSADSKYQEADLAQRLRNKIAGILRTQNFNVITDGGEGENLPRRDAVARAKQNHGPSVEIHFNAGPPTAVGIEALADAKLKFLSKLLCAAIAKHTKGPLRGQQGWKSPGSGQHHRLAFCDAGGIILEVAFISNHTDLQAYLAVENEVAAELANVLARAAAQPGA